MARPNAKAEAKPVVDLDRCDGNAFSILAAASRAARRAGWNQERIDKVLAEAKSGDYDHLLQTIMKHFDVT